MPPSNYIPLDGQRFGRLLVLHRAPSGPGWSTRWICRCDCGTIVNTQGRFLREKTAQSCGCLKNERTGLLNKTHGLSRRPEYFAYHTSRARCEHPNAEGYANYGGRGIRFLWNSFEEFFAEMGPRPSPKHTLERIDNDGPYSKENCRWATRQEQGNNKRNNRMVDYHGTSFTLAQLARHLGLTSGCLRYRILHNLAY
jgi:hypothetical protein